VILALGVPLAVTLERRTLQDFESDLLVRTLDIAARIHGRVLSNPVAANLQEQLVDNDPGADERIVVVDAEGILVADSDGRQSLGEPYAEPGRPEILEALRARPNSQPRFSSDLGQDIVVAAAPVFDENPNGETVVAGAVRITDSIAELRSDIRATRIGLIVICSAALLAGLLMALVLSGQLARPIARLTSAAHRLGRGDLDARAGNVGTGGEIGDLAHSFDDMADRTERTVQAQREFVANASHQLRTPLTGMKLRLESAIAEAPSDEIRRQLEAADREVDRLAEIVDRLLVMAKRIEAGEATHADTGEAVARAMERWRERAERAGSRLTADVDDAVAQANPADLDQLLDNLLDNAVAYAPGPIHIQTEHRDGRIVVAIRDHGPGLSPEEIARATERFYRGARAPHGGSGLGLAIARQLTEKWGGSLTLSTPDDEGLLVEIELPAAAPARAPEEPRP
jgi:two-component system, OmpR family, sensor kinase